ncbi:MerR family transcriptional regulator [Catenuloplanes indicus]|uniref:DNA-binding transcriptional MerR regulator n=1 Tax=Catenuloplanes indicus TaxID=137267 RepID=A0AAE4AVW9_9ACTN|nr:MerR family transcriptional regulator [Catenuloplanes indicus]MDQ0364414.1 DNA-binding transcriptional MerR regulator [Catenuloplanes indicus]
MRISELSRRAGTPVGTIKFYLRERLLPPGRPTNRNQASYGEAHVNRLRLIRTLTVMAGLDLSSVRLLLSAIENGRLPLAGLYRVMEAAVAADHRCTGGPEADAARTDVDALVDRMGWSLDQDAVSRRQLVEVLAALKRLGSTCEVDFFLPYAAAADDLVQGELDFVPAAPTNGERAAAVVRGLMFEVALTAMGRMAREHHVTRRFGPAAED